MHDYSTTSPLRFTCPDCGSLVFSPGIITQFLQTQSGQDYNPFWAKLEVRGPDDCWPWKLSLDAHGYGNIRWHGRARKAQQVAWELIYGPWPKGLFGCHSCDVRYPIGDSSYRRCCNPFHIWPGTSAENVADMIHKGRGATGERNGNHTHPETRPRGDDHWAKRMPELIPRGEARGGRVVLTQDLVLELRHRYQDGERYAGLAREYGLNAETIRDAVLGRRWSHLAPTEVIRPYQPLSGDEHWMRQYPEKIARGDRSGARLHPEKVARGEANGFARLTEPQVREIRLRHQAGETEVALAKEFGVRQTTISQVVTRVTWRHVQ